jgi:hypothetical protein
MSSSRGILLCHFKGNKSWSSTFCPLVLWYLCSFQTCLSSQCLSVCKRAPGLWLYRAASINYITCNYSRLQNCKSQTDQDAQTYCTSLLEAEAGEASADLVVVCWKPCLHPMLPELPGFFLSPMWTGTTYIPATSGHQGLSVAWTPGGCKIQQITHILKL